MTGAARAVGMALLVLSGGGATAAAPQQFAAADHLCKHCNCFMPVGTDPESTCAVCKCGKQAHQCIRGR